MIRQATLQDLAALVALENQSFESDRLSRRSFRHLLTKANAVTLIAEREGRLAGYATLLFNAGTSLARLYSIAVDRPFQGTGVGRELVTAAEVTALEEECAYLRLEARVDNQASLKLFQSMDYRQFGQYIDYYEDHVDAIRLEKALMPHLDTQQRSIAYYRQTLEFTCGPAALMMAMHALNPNIELNRRLEIRIWRESTTVFMTAGHGGCGPYGLALAAYHRGFDVDIVVNDPGALFIDSVRSEEKKAVMRLVHEDFVEEVEQSNIAVDYHHLTVDEMYQRFVQGGVLVVLISSYRIYKEKFPHWVVVTGFDEHYIYVHDPFVDDEKGKVVGDCLNMPILKKDFERMSRYGKSGLRAALIINFETGAER